MKTVQTGVGALIDEDFIYYSCKDKEKEHFS